MKQPARGSEQWYALQEEFIRYIINQVNPARLDAGLSEIREHEARECFRILDDFHRKLEE